MAPTLHAERLSDGIVRHVVQGTRSGRFAPGQRLPSERQLAESLGVSRVSVREGLRILELLEVIEVRHNAGAFVTAQHARSSGRLLRHWLTTHRSAVIDLLEVREALESRSAEAAAGRRVEVKVPSVAEDVSIEEATAADVEFHNRVADASGNNVLITLIHELNDILKESRYAMFAMPGRATRSQREHAKIAAAIRRGDTEGARAAMRRHITQVREQVQQLTDNGDVNT